MKVLFLTFELYEQNGGGFGTRSYLKAIQMFAGTKNVIPLIFTNKNIETGRFDNEVTFIEKQTTIAKVSNLILRRDTLASVKLIKKIIDIVDKEKIDIILLARSYQWSLVEQVKKTSNIPVIALYHDICPEVIKSRWRVSKKTFILQAPKYYQWKKNEKKCSLEADANIVLNIRERNKFVEYYAKEPDLVLPGSMCEDRFSPNLQNSTKSCSDKFLICFIGSDLIANVAGIKWFVKNVMPRLPEKITLQIIGRGMERLKLDESFDDQRIDIVGTVDSLDSYYYNADLIVAPIFEGTGMKTKTAEALMFGKTVLATPEALCGYEDTGLKPCQTEQDFIGRITEYCKCPPPKYDENIRKLYEEMYSSRAIVPKLQNLFDNILSKNR